MSIQLNGFEIGNDSPLTVMGGVNVLENEDLVMRVAESFKEATEKNKINWIFKGSFDKANRSSIDSFRGPGLEEGLEILQKVKEHFNVPIITDIHGYVLLVCSIALASFAVIPLTGNSNCALIFNSVTYSGTFRYPRWNPYFALFSFFKRAQFNSGFLATIPIDSVRCFGIENTPV